MRRFAVLSLFVAVLFLCGCAQTQKEAEIETKGASAASPGETITLAVEGMAWGGCANAVQVALKEVPGVSSVHIDMLTKKAVVQIEKGKTTEDQLANAVNKAEGMHEYRATPIKTTP